MSDMDDFLKRNQELIRQQIETEERARWKKEDEDNLKFYRSMAENLKLPRVPEPPAPSWASFDSVHAPARTTSFAPLASGPPLYAPTIPSGPNLPRRDALTTSYPYVKGKFRVGKSTNHAWAVLVVLGLIVAILAIGVDKRTWRALLRHTRARLETFAAEKETPVSATITSEKLNLRDLPNPSAHISAVFNRGTLVAILSNAKDGWKEVNVTVDSVPARKLHGFMKEQYLEIKSTSPQK